MKEVDKIPLYNVDFLSAISARDLIEPDWNVNIAIVISCKSINCIDLIEPDWNVNTVRKAINNKAIKKI